MCRNIIQLRRPDGPPTDEELRNAARQYVRKITGYREPSRQNQVAFEAAIDEIARSGRVLLDHIVVGASRGVPVRHTHGGVRQVHEARSRPEATPENRETIGLTPVTGCASPP